MHWTHFHPPILLGSFALGTTMSLSNDNCSWIEQVTGFRAGTSLTRFLPFLETFGFAISKAREDVRDTYSLYRSGASLRDWCKF